jgi:hypothetical protein
MQTSAVSEVINKLKSVLILGASAASCWLKLLLKVDACIHAGEPLDEGRTGLIE